METRVVYRIENPEDKDGMWYNKDGIFRKTIHILCPNGIAKDFPMPSNLTAHRKDGKIWQSAVDILPRLKSWDSSTAHAI